MTQEDKELLLKDLCARLPYGVKVHIKGEYHKYHKIEEIDVSSECVRYFENLHLYEEKITDCRLYLRPMSSMTDEEFNSLKEETALNYNNQLDLVDWNNGCKTLEFWLKEIPSYVAILVFDWLNSHHFDYRGLIEKGLVIAVTKENNPYEN